MTKFFPKLSILSLTLLTLSNLNAQTGTWKALAHTAPDFSQGLMELMTDGTVMCFTETGGTDGTVWDKLTPDATGSYINGTWTAEAAMHNDRLFFSTQVLPSGKMYVAGGEYGAGTSKGEVYDPVANTWTNCGAIPGGWKIYDGNSEILYNGNVLEGPQISSNSSFSIEQWSPTTLNYTTEADAPKNHDEAAWLKLPDSTVLYVGIGSNNSCRFQPQTNTWLNDANTPNNMYDPYGEESGCALQLPNGNDIFFGSTKYNNIYTPSGHYNTLGTWAAAANMPTISGAVTGQVDAPGAMMVNGHILLAVSPGNTSSGDQFRAPVWFVEYDYTTNTFTQVTSVIPGVGADSIAGEVSNFITFLDLPDGNVMMSIEQGNINQYWEYVPGSAAIAAGKPTINSIIRDACPDYKITGKLFNGISEGASFGDDWQMSTNYPLIRFMKGTNVYYGKTTNWNRIGAVATDSLKDTCVFTTPAALAAGTTYTVQIVVNGFGSNTTLFTTLGVTSIVDTNLLCHGGATGSATVSAVGTFAPYTYSWSGGGTNAKKTGMSAGTYTVTVTDNNGCTVTASTTITQPAALTATIGKGNVSCRGGSNGSDTAKASGGTSPYTYLWTGGSTKAINTGLSAGSFTLTVTDINGCTVTASAAITQPASGITTTASVTTNVKCHGENDGSASSSPLGGTAPYTYLWSPGGNTNQNATTLSAGSFTVTVTDHGGCTATASVTLTQPATGVGVSASVTTNLTCNGGSNAAVSSTPSGGTGAYTYSWSGGGTNSTKSGLSGGTYTITVTDNIGCTSSASVNISEPAPIVSARYLVQADPGSCNGIAAVTVTSGGTAPFTYLWSPGNQTTDTIKAQCIGSFCCTVTDAHGCSDSTCVIISQSSLGIAGISNASNINVYPDPNSGSFIVAGVIKGQVVELFNDLGQQLSNTIADKTTMYFDISNRADGVYLIRILDKDGTLVTQRKLVKTQ